MRQGAGLWYGAVCHDVSEVKRREDVEVRTKRDLAKSIDIRKLQTEIRIGKPSGNTTGKSSKLCIVSRVVFKDFFLQQRGKPESRARSID